MNPQAITTDDLNGIVEDVVSAPVFFDSTGEPSAAVKKLTGARVSNHQERCATVGLLRMLGASDREICSAVGCDSRSIPLMLSAAEKSGRIPALKERLSAVVGDNAERSNLVLRDLLNRVADNKESDDLAGLIRSVSVAVGITTEKALLLMGSATEIVEVRSGAGREDVERWWRETVVPVQAEVVSSVVPSIEMPANAGDSGPVTGERHMEGAGQVGDGRVSGADLGREAATAGDRGGGSCAAAGGESADGSTGL